MFTTYYSLHSFTLHFPPRHLASIVYLREDEHTQGAKTFIRRLWTNFVKIYIFMDYYLYWAFWYQICNISSFLFGNITRFLVVLFVYKSQPPCWYVRLVCNNATE